MKPGTSITAGDFTYICDLVRDESALTIGPGKEYLVESRLEPLAREEGFPSCQDLIRTLRAGRFPNLRRRVAEAMTTNETSFFRDARAFEMLARVNLPALVAGRSAERSLNIWCAGCASGQEPYSVAMLLREHRPSLDGWSLRIVASDISRNVLARARAGRYSRSEVDRGLPASLLVKYFEQQESAWEVRPEIRRMVEFREINLIEPWPRLPAMQLILLRNVLIYLDIEARKAVLARAGRLLDPRGFLLLGGAETTANLDESFEPVSSGGAVCFRRRQRPRTSCAVSRP